MEERKLVEEKLLKALAECWYLPRQEKKFWIDNVSGIPDRTLKNILTEIQNSNSIMKECIKAALEKNPANTYLHQIKSKISSIKAKAFAMDEKMDKEKLDKDMEEQIKNM